VTELKSHASHQFTGDNFYYTISLV